MELDPFCESAISRGVFSCKRLDNTTIRPKTGISKIDNYIRIVIDIRYEWNIGKGGYVRSGRAYFHLKTYTTISHLEDIEDLYDNTLEMNKKEDFITLHNYCCRRLREEIDKIYPEYSLTKLGKKS